MIRIKRVKRIAVAVMDLEKAVDNWKRLFGVQTFQVGEEPEDRYHWAAFEIGTTRGDAEMTMEFLAPFNDPNGEMLIGKFIKNRGEGLYMVTLETEGTVEEVSRELKETGIASSWGGLTKQWVAGMESVGIENWTEHYISPKDTNGVLVTLASVKYLPPKLVKTAPGTTFKKEKAST